MNTMVKTRKKRKPMSAEQKAAAGERLEKARAAKAPAKQTSIHESIRDLDADDPLSPIRIKSWIKSCREELKAMSYHKTSKDAKEKSAWYSLEAYIRNMQTYLSSGVWLDLFYGEKRNHKINFVCTRMAYNADGTPKYIRGMYYPGMGLYKGAGEFEETGDET